MTTVVRYGVASALNLNLPPERLVATCGAPGAEPLSDPSATVAAAVEHPLDFPPLSSAVVPGDEVVLAIDPAVPQVPHVVAPVIQTLLAAGVEPRAIVVLTAADPAAEEVDPLELLPADLRDQVQSVRHVPDQRNALSYLAATTAGARPIYLNRVLCDAAFVIPIGCLRPPTAIAYHGVSGGLYPTFSDDKTLRRYRAPGLLDQRAEIGDKARREADEVAWLLGVQFAIGVVPGPGGKILHVLAGALDSVNERGRQRSEAAWNYSVPQRASLVVAAIEGTAAEQTWENFGRALAAASRAVTDDGAIAICCDLQREPGPAIQQLANAESLHQAVRKIRKDRAGDVLPATQLAQALDRVKVYLLSRLDESLVEDLGVAAVAAPQEIERLATRHPSCIVLANAQHTVAIPARDD